jgi:ketosteroid isomerase-like protein
LADAVDEAVEVWSPSLYTTSRVQLVEALAARDDAVVDLRVDVERVTHLGRRVLVEWRVVGRFDNAGFLNDDVLVEPTHRSVESAGVMILTFRDELVVRIDCFFDALALLEQVLDPDGPA